MNMNHSDPSTIYQSTLYNIPEDLKVQHLYPYTN